MWCCADGHDDLAHAYIRGLASSKSPAGRQGSAAALQALPSRLLKPCWHAALTALGQACQVGLNHTGSSIPLCPPFKKAQLQSNGNSQHARGAYSLGGDWVNFRRHLQVEENSKQRDAESRAAAVRALSSVAQELFPFSGHGVVEETNADSSDDAPGAAATLQEQVISPLLLAACDYCTDDR